MGTRFTLSIMDKQEIKGKLLEGIRSNRYINAIKSVAVFGSYVNGQPREDSDVDVLVRFDEDAEIGFFEYVRIQRHLSAAVGLKVDMVTPEALSRFIKQQVIEEAEVIYER
jgi:predicted nucleotidyltransferase